MKSVVVFLTMVLLLIDAGCSARPYYEGLRLQQEMECRGMQGADRDECERHSGMSYDEYQRQIKEREKDK